MVYSKVVQSRTGKPVVNEPKVVSQPKVWSDAPIIEEYESDSEDEHVSLPTEEQETPSFANQQVKTPRETVKNQFTHSKNPKVDKKGLGYGFTTKACFVCGSLSHLIRDCDFHEKRMAKQAELNNRMSKKSSQREIRTIWNNVQRVNHKNQFVPTAVLTRTGKIPVSTARASGTNKVSTARHNFNSQAVLTNAARKISTVKPFVNKVRPKTVFHKTYSPFSRPFKNTIALRTKFSYQKVNTVEDYPYRALQNKGIVDSGCSRHMTGNKAYLVEYQNFNDGPVAFGGGKGYITGKGKIKIGKLDFEDVCFVKDLQHFNLFSVSQICDKKNKVLFTDSEWKGPTWLFDLDYLTDSMNYQPVSSENQANKHVGPKDANHNVGTKDINDVGDSKKEAESAQTTIFAQDTKDLLLQAGAAKASETNTVNTASTPVSTTSPYGGLSFSELTSADQDNSEIPALEEIYNNPTDGIFTNASYDDEGAVADFTNLETIVNVSPIPTSRINSIHPSTLILGDPKLAVQTRSKVTKSSRAHAFVSYILKQKRNNHKDFHHCLFACFLSQNEPKNISEALENKSWVDAMQEELLQFKI
ncbi:hypothetical protein Tco_0013118 [Tanacetum coccineum]